MEEEPFAILQTPEGKLRMDVTNSALFTFLGRSILGQDLASRDHVFIRTEVNGEDGGIYIFQTAPAYTEIAEYMASNGFPMHLNARQIPECDEDAYQRLIEKLATEEAPEDFIPEEWA